MKTVRLLISGRVQGVGYRDWVRRQALDLGLTGWVRNLRDGCVELVACGEEAPLRELEQWLWQGPPRARVTQVKVQETVAQSFDGFFVRG